MYATNLATYMYKVILCEQSGEGKKKNDNSHLRTNENLGTEVSVSR